MTFVEINQTKHGCVSLHNYGTGPVGLLEAGGISNVEFNSYMPDATTIITMSM